MKNFSIFKVQEKKNPNSPDYTISMKYGDKYITVGGGWIKEGKSGKYISCKLSDTYKGVSSFSLKEDESMAVGSDIPESDIPL